MTKEEKQAAAAAASEAAMAEFFARGGQVQLLEPLQSGRVAGEPINRWVKKKPVVEVAPNEPTEE